MTTNQPRSPPPSVNPYVTFSKGDTYRFVQALSVLFTLFYSAIFIIYIVYVPMKTKFLYGFYRPDLHPGPFLDDRYNFFWGLVMISMVRLMAIPGMLWVHAGDAADLWFRASVIRTVFQLLIMLDLFLIVTWAIVGCFFCNNGAFRNGVCDDPNLSKYCDAWWLQQPEACEPGPTPPANSSTLSKNVAWFNVVYFSLGFLGLDLIACIFLPYGFSIAYRAMYSISRPLPPYPTQTTNNPPRELQPSLTENEPEGDIPSEEEEDEGDAVGEDEENENMDESKTVTPVPVDTSTKHIDEGASQFV